MNTEKDQSETQQSCDRSLLRRHSSEVTVNDDLHVYDVTLRDGAQTPNVNFSPNERREITELLDDFGARYIEAGYPAREDTEKTIVPTIDATTNSTVVGLAGVNQAEIDAVLDCDLSAISVYAAGSEIHRKNRGGTDVGTLRTRVANAVQYATSHGLEVRFAVIDGTRTDPDVLFELGNVAAECGADMFGISDTVGVLTPMRSREIVESVQEEVNLPVSVHYHDDMGMSVGNSIAAAETRASQVHTTVNGIGANAGNTPLAQFSTAIEVLHDHQVGKLDLLPALSKTVANYSGIDLSPMAPVVGKNAFKYASSSRIEGVQMDPVMYEAFPPGIVGQQRSFDGTSDNDSC